MNKENDSNHVDLDPVDEPVMDGADDQDEDGNDSCQGMSDPAPIRHPQKRVKNVAPYCF